MTPAFLRSRDAQRVNAILSLYDRARTGQAYGTLLADLDNVVGLVSVLSAQLTTRRASIDNYETAVLFIGQTAGLPVGE